MKELKNLKDNSIIFLGTNWSYTSIKCLSKLLEEEYNVIAVISSTKKGCLQKIKNCMLDILLIRKNNLKKIANSNGIRYFQTSDINTDVFIKLISTLEPYLVCSVIFSQILKKDIIQIPKKGVINLHPSLLPNYRGPDPYFWVMKNGEPETGVTVHFVDEGIDTGDIILQKSYKLRDGIEIAELRKDIADICPDILTEAVDLIFNNKYQKKKISQGKGTYFPSPTKNDYILDYQTGIKKIYNFMSCFKRNHPILQLPNIEYTINEVLSYDYCNHNKFPDYELHNNILIFYARDGVIKFKIYTHWDKKKDKILNLLNILRFRKSY